MIDIYADLKDTGLYACQQGTVIENRPDSYLTVWNDYSGDNLNGDNETVLIEYNFTIIYYTTEWNTIYSEFEKIISLLKSKNYVVDGNGFDIDSGDDNYMARCIEVRKLERRI
jgi:hypothetical protein